jgi:hypothetical protein
MTQEMKSARVYPINLRGIHEGYTFPCSNINCPGKSPGQELPEGCDLLKWADRVSPLKTEIVLERLVQAKCFDPYTSVE